MFGEAGQFIPTNKVTLWWNLEREEWGSALTSTPSPAQSGHVRLLGETNVTDQCDWTLQFQVPDYPPRVTTQPCLYATLNSTRTVRRDALFDHCGDLRNRDPRLSRDRTMRRQYVIERLQVGVNEPRRKLACWGLLNMSVANPNRRSCAETLRQCTTPPMELDYRHHANKWDRPKTGDDVRAQCQVVVNGGPEEGHYAKGPHGCNDHRARSRGTSSSCTSIPVIS